MPTLVVPPRVTPDTEAMLASALAAVNAQRRRLAVIDELPAREAYAAWMEHLLSTIEAHHGAH